MQFPDPSEARLVAEERPGDNAGAMTVSELSARLKRIVEGEFGHVRLRGEISGFKRAASGHLYFSLKDANAVIDAVMWKGTAGSIAFAPEDGLDVIATGKLTIYPGRSKYQIVVDRLELAGEGALMQLLERRKAALLAEGLFDAARKQPLPYLPRVIGVVTSPTGAVIRDILHRLADRMPSHVLVWPVRVQGEGAASEVAAAIAGFDALASGGPVPRPDLVIVARGGGSIEDLWAFNEEAVVRAVAACRIPLISAVGHETDTTLTDFAADMRAPTPTAAAEMAVPVRADLAAFVRDLETRAIGAVRRHSGLAAERMRALLRLLPRPENLLAPQRQRVDDLGDRLPRGLRNRLVQAEGALARAGGSLRPALLTQRLAREQERLAQLWRLLQQLHPEGPLNRGYALVADRAGKVLVTAAAARSAAAITVRFADGAVPARVERAPGEAYNADRPQQPKLL